jgi:AcrR family transcriptional regulator
MERDSLRRAPTQKRARDRVERILDAADRLLAAEGAEALGTKQVAAAAGISIGSLYFWFPDKESIAEELALRYWSELSDLVAGVAEATETGELADSVAEVLDALAAGFRGRPGFLALWFGGLRTERLRDATRPYRDEVASCVERILATGSPEIDPVTKGTVASMVVLLGDGILREAFRLNRDGEPTLLAEGGHVLRAYIDQRLKESHAHAVIR